MRLALDAGNSFIKVGLFNKETLIKHTQLKHGESLLRFLTLEEIGRIATIISCSVIKHLNIKDLPAVKTIHINHHSVFPFKLQYKTPETLGIDRVVACCSLWNNRTDLLVIDAGSCITYDLVTGDSGYIGGAISPGLKMRFKAMNNFTDKLPFVSQIDEHPALIGMTTKDCLKSGVIHGIVNEIEGFICSFKDKYPNINVFLTGGDAIFLCTALKSVIFADQNLVLKGLNSLIRLNEE